MLEIPSVVKSPHAADNRTTMEAGLVRNLITVETRSDSAQIKVVIIWA